MTAWRWRMAMLLVPLIAYGVWYWWPPYRPAWWATIKVGDSVLTFEKNVEHDMSQGVYWASGGNRVRTYPFFALDQPRWNRRMAGLTLIFDSSGKILEIRNEMHDFGPAACWNQARDRWLAPAAFGLRKLILGY